MNPQRMPSEALYPGRLRHTVEAMGPSVAFPVGFRSAPLAPSGFADDLMLTPGIPGASIEGALGCVRVRVPRQVELETGR